MKWLIRKFNEFLPLTITLGLTVLMALLYQLAPSLLESVDGNPYTPYYNASEFHDILRRALKLFAYTGIAIATMMMLAPGTWARLEKVFKDKDYEPKWIRDTFIYCLFLALLLALVLV